MLPSTRTKLNAEDFTGVREAIIRYLADHEYITNRLLRGITEIGYDQAIFAFNELVGEGTLNRIGSASATRYVLARKQRR